MKKHVYVAEQNKGFNFTVVTDDKRTHVRFVDGQFTTDDDDLADAIDKLRLKNRGIARRCRKADRVAAEKLARAHRDMLARTGSIKGGVTAEAARRSMDLSLAERDLELRAKKVDTEEFAKNDLQLTEAVDNPPEKADETVIAEPVATPAIKIGNILNPKAVNSG